MPTQLCYFRDSSLLTSRVVLRGQSSAPDTGLRLRFDMTTFYPQGGGQRSDQGTVRRTGCELKVIKAAYVPEEDEVDHVCELVEGEGSDLVIGSEFEMAVDAKLREWHSRLHSAGHVVDAALLRMGLLHSSLSVSSAYHYQEGPYIEYDGVVSDLSKDDLKAKVEEVCNSLVSENLPVFIEFENDDVLDTKCRRSMRIADEISIPCGGTHVKSLGELGPITIRKVQVKQGKTRVCYSVQK